MRATEADAPDADAVVVSRVVASLRNELLVEYTYIVLPRRKTSGTDPLYDCQPGISDQLTVSTL